MKSHLRTIIIIILSSFLLFVAMVYLNNMSTNNGFERKFIGKNLELINVIDLPLGHLNFVAPLRNNIILKDYKNPKFLYLIDSKNAKFDKIPINLPANFNLKSRYFNLDASGDNVFVSNAFGESALIRNHQTLPFKIENLAFDQVVVLSPRSVIVRSVNQKGKIFQRFLHKIQLSKEGTITKTFELVAQIDGFFCNDGWLNYDDEQGKVVYTYFYRGNFLSLDTNLNLIYTGKTIDTVKYAKIKVSELNSKSTNGNYKKSIKQAKPPEFINKISALDLDKVYILSALKADNENYFKFLKNQVVDVYSIGNGQYMYSFYIPNYKGLKPYEIQVKTNSITAIYNNYLVNFNLNF